MQRRVFLKMVLAAAPTRKVISNRLKKALNELEKAAQEELGVRKLEVSIGASDRTPLLIQARRALD